MFKKNLLVVNAVKTKCMTIGDSTPLYLHFNGNKIEQAIQYKYLGNILKSINNCKADMFANTYPYLCDQGRKAIFSMPHKLKRNITTSTQSHVQTLWFYYKAYIDIW